MKYETKIKIINFYLESWQGSDLLHDDLLAERLIELFDIMEEKEDE